MVKTKSVKVSSRYQMAIPSYVREKLEIEAGDRLLIEVYDGMFVAIPQPEDFVAYMTGLGKEVWESVDSDEYLRQERDAWTTSETD